MQSTRYEVAAKESQWTIHSFRLGLIGNPSMLVTQVYIHAMNAFQSRFLRKLTHLMQTHTHSRLTERLRTNLYLCLV